MTDAIQRELERANRELGAARGLIDLGYPEKAVSSCYYAVFRAATDPECPMILPAGADAIAWSEGR